MGAHAGLAVLDEAPRGPIAGLTLPGARLAVAGLPTLPSPALAAAPVPGPQGERARAGFGLQAGYNHQLDPGSGVVIGIETDVTGLSALPKR